MTRNAASISILDANLDQRAWPGSADIVGAFARDPVTDEEAQQIWDEFVTWAGQFGESMHGDGGVDLYVENAREDFDLTVPQGREAIEDAIVRYMDYIEANYERLDNADTKSSPPPARRAAGDGRDYAAEIAEALGELDILKELASMTVDGNESFEDKIDALLEISQEAAQLRLKIPVKDYDANEIPDGVAADLAYSDFLIWLDEQATNLEAAASGSVKSTAPTNRRGWLSSIASTFGIGMSAPEWEKGYSDLYDLIWTNISYAETGKASVDELNSAIADLDSIEASIDDLESSMPAGEDMSAEVSALRSSLERLRSTLETALQNANAAA